MEGGVGGWGMRGGRGEREAGRQLRAELVNGFMEKWGFKCRA